MSAKVAISALLVCGTSGAASSGCYIYTKQYSSAGNASSDVNASEPQTEEAPAADNLSQPVQVQDAPEQTPRQEPKDAGENSSDPHDPTKGPSLTEDLSGGGDGVVEGPRDGGETPQTNGGEDSVSGTPEATDQPVVKNESSDDSKEKGMSAEDQAPQNSGGGFLSRTWSWLSGS